VPSNSAGDVICLRLLKYQARGWLNQDSVVRFLASQRDLEEVPEKVREIVVQEDMDADDPAAGLLDSLASARIVVSTWHMCGTLHLKELKYDISQSHAFSSKTNDTSFFLIQ
jgi:hypothetical protein